jgi:hypothetical protein
MKKNFVILPLVFAVMSGLLAGCVSSGGTKAVIDKSIVAGNGGANVKVSYDVPKRPPSKIDVFVDDFIYLTLSAGKTGQFVVPDGEHSIYAIQTGLLPWWATTKLQFTATSNEMHFTIFKVDVDKGSGDGIDIKQDS